ncbi:mitochondrial distribution and morphology protein-domain-containing protein [Pseudomassariella vexata]|uniref:Mitochondrial distribution and morphology protein-domain-containing protein n=1 Tax=Pseudomassariella vexata TaxID=1141098 RepID=A0A1Y2E4K4_9PEZI|nr:mitochondrial distribution and morphology protein-domain-containing protein [Pseudomassariella vexata]ORY65795.1 mitochondrial distribution and morphology protein-domain-containing protein [Pseudomassariella vexata]
MSSSARSSLLGQHGWRSFYETVDFLASRLPPRQTTSNRLGLNQSSPYSTSSILTLRTPKSSPWTSPRPSRSCAYYARRSFTSGGLLLVGITPNPSTTSNVIATCAAVADSAAVANVSQKASVSKLGWQAWQRGIHTGRMRNVGLSQRAKSTKAGADASKPSSSQQNTESPKPANPSSTETKPPEPNQTPHSVSNYFHLPHLPHLPHRPTKEEFLAAANGFMERLKVRFKWFSIRSMRPWNNDEWGAFLSFFLFGHLAWILLGTTTFMSLVIFSINTVFAQETLGQWVGDYMTQSAGLTIVFESAIVPKWKDGVISFRNVFVSRRPGQSKSSVSKGSSSSAAAVAAAERGAATDVAAEVDDGNYTQFDVTLNTVNVTLSFVKWWNGKGLLKDVEVKGVRGVIDRTSVQWSSDNVDPLSYRHEHHPGDFEIDSFKLEDLLVTVHQPSGFRPFSVSIFSCELPQLRKQYMFYDFLSATHMSGSYDGSLFTIHPRQVHGVPAGHEHISNDLGEPGAWKKFSRLRIDGLKIDHLNRGDEGPFGWIYEGNVDIVADVMFPNDDDDSITKVVSDFYDRLEEAVTSNRYIHLLESNTRRYRGDETTANPSTSVEAVRASEHIPEATLSDKKYVDEAAVLSTTTSTSDGEPPRYLVMDLRIHLNDVKASVPVFSSNLSYVNQALVRPIVAYINAKRTYIPISCRIVKRASDFDGAWSTYDSGMMTDLSAEVYSAFANDVEDQQSRTRRLKKVGFWTLSLAVHALFMGMAGNVI